MKVQTLIINALIAALYFVITWLVAPFGFTHIQFRLSELFNHFIVFNKKFFFGIVGGVFLANLFLSPMKVDLIFGLAHSIISLLITMLISRYIKSKITLMWINSIVFSFNMFIIAYMLKVYLQVDLSFMFIWGTSAISEFITMAIAIPIVYLLSKRINLAVEK
ncbi:MAG TPA: QueT transporter family protein [Pseudogracilibacillus sp.]|nr:QueT transporter family protein [Pseudogracilibacillus sp.]